MVIREPLSNGGFGASFSVWKTVGLIGLNLVLLALLIFLFPALLAYLIAAFLLLNGSLLLAAAYYLRKQERRFSRGQTIYWESGGPGW